MIDDDESSRLKKVEIFLCINIYSAAQVPGSTVGRLSSAIWLHKYTEYMNVDKFTHISLWAACLYLKNLWRCYNMLPLCYQDVKKS